MSRWSLYGASCDVRRGAFYAFVAAVLRAALHASQRRGYRRGKGLRREGLLNPSHPANCADCVFTICAFIIVKVYFILGSL
jgi:hypothetical protein